MKKFFSKFVGKFTWCKSLMCSFIIIKSFQSFMKILMTTEHHHAEKRSVKRSNAVTSTAFDVVAKKVPNIQSLNCPKHVQKWRQRCSIVTHTKEITMIEWLLLGRVFFQTSLSVIYWHDRRVELNGNSLARVLFSCDVYGFYGSHIKLTSKRWNDLSYSYQNEQARE